MKCVCKQDLQQMEIIQLKLWVAQAKYPNESQILNYSFIFIHTIVYDFVTFCVPVTETGCMARQRGLLGGRGTGSRSALSSHSPGVKTKVTGQSFLSTTRPPGYERVYLPLCKVADTSFHIQGDEDHQLF